MQAAAGKDKAKRTALQPPEGMVQGTQAGLNISSVMEETDLRKWDAWQTTALEQITVHVAVERQRIADFRTKATAIATKASSCRNRSEWRAAQAVHVTRTIGSEAQEFVKMFEKLST